MNYQDLFDTAHSNTFVKQGADTIAKRVAKTTGLKRTEEQKARIGLANSTKTRTEEQKAHLSAINTGKKLSAETRAKVSANSKQARPVMTPHGVFPSKIAVARAAGTYIEKVTYWMKRYPKHYYFVA
jgi:hypothetical protein